MSRYSVACQVTPLFAFSATAAILLSLYGHSLNMDSSAFLVVGRGWLAGVPPYSGLWDDKPPAIYILAAIASLIDRHGDGVIAFRLLSIGSVVATALTVDKILRHITGRIDAGIAGALLATILLACPLLSLGGGLTETFATPGMSIALLAALKLRSGPSRAAFVVGAGLGWAASCSLLALGIIPVLAFVWLSEPTGRKAGVWKALVARVKPRSLAWFTFGGAAVCAACWAPIVLSGSVGTGVEAVVGYKALYRSLAIFNPVQWLVWFIFLAPFWLSALVAAVLIRRDDHPQLTRIAAIWIAGGVGWLLYGERFYPHYLLLLMVPAALLTIAGGLRCRNLKSPHTRLVATAVYAAIVIMGIELILNGSLPSPMPEAMTDRAVASYIDAHTAQSDGIYVWGYCPDIYLSADRMPRGRFFYLLPLSTPGFGGSAADEVLRAWSSDPPLFVVDASYATVNHGAAEPLLVDHPGTTEDRRTASATLDRLRTFVRDHYELAVIVGEKRIYRYRG